MRLRRASVVLRRGIALTLVGGLTLVVALSYVPASSFAPCRDQLTVSGNIVHMCHPVGTDDVVAIGLILLCAVAFIWPDLSEVAIPGLVSLKKEVSATKLAVAETERRTAAVTTDVQNINLALPKPDMAQAAQAQAMLRAGSAPRVDDDPGSGRPARGEGDGSTMTRRSRVGMGGLAPSAVRGARGGLSAA